MIYEVIKAAVEAVEPLKDNMYPVGACVDDVEMPCAVYTFGKRQAERDLSGMLHHYTDVIDIDLLGDSYDELHSLWFDVEEQLQALSHTETESGEYVFGVEVTSPDTDAADLTVGLMRRSLRCTLQWCPTDE